jgi:YD repeat-containing protein
LITVVYDAWNRLVTVKDAVGTTLKGYAYDGLHRRI